MANFDKYLEINIKQLDKQFGSGFKGVRFSSKSMQEEGNIQEQNTLQYEFTNLGRYHIKINEVILYSSIINPIAVPLRSTWKPDMKWNEFDTTKYVVTFHKDIP